MKCDICKSKLILNNIGYIRTLEKGKKVFECKRCHNIKKRAERNRKLNNSWLLVA